MPEYFFDTYALYEILRENKNYSDYNFSGMVTTKLNLMELHYGLLSTHGKGMADGIFYRFLNNCTEINENTIIEANLFRKENKHLKMSCIDCLGYAIARSRKVKFLTGDNAFRGLENVEFVK